MAATNVDDEWLAGLERKLASMDGQIGLKEFKELLSLKGFLAERFFQNFDKTGSGSLSTRELIDGIKMLTKGSKLDKLRFLFQVYDVKGTGDIDPEELRIVLESCVGETSLKLSDEQLDDLTEVLFDDADVDGSGIISFEALKEQLDRNPGLLDNLTVSVADWLSPGQREQHDSHVSHVRFIRNNIPYVVTLILLAITNAALFIYKVITYKDSGAAICIARACGICIAFNSIAVIVVMLRKTMTWLRGTAIAPYLPLDHYIDLHKIIAWVIVLLAGGHTIAHFVNFGLVVSEPNVTFAYWEYLVPIRTDIGWVNGSAGFTGIMLLLVLSTMFICSQSFVRRCGHFEVFYWTHMLFTVFYVVQIIHSENFWKWFIVPGTAYAVERVLRSKPVHLARYGRTYIVQGNAMPSKVTRLVISRPPGFSFQPGDYLFLQIPVIAKYEWHPFTISSSPEKSDVFWLHIRSAGTWTTKVYEYFGRRNSHSRLALSAVNSRTSHFSTFTGRQTCRNRAYLSPMASGTQNSRNDIERGSSTTSRQPAGPIECYIDGPYGSPSAHIFQAEHAVLVGAGIGVTPFAAILQTIVKHYDNAKVHCPRCNNTFTGEIPQSVMRLKKVDFFWINRDQHNFEWFVSLLTQLEAEQSSDSSNFHQFLEMHMYMTSALKKDDVKVIYLQMAFDLLHKSTQKDVITGLKTRTKAGRPDWNEVFDKVSAEGKGKVTIFYCGPPALGKVLKSKCHQYGFGYRRENF